MLSFKKILVFNLILFLSFSCSTKKEKPEPSAEKAYLEAMKLLKSKSFFESAEAFEKIDDDFPFSKWALKAKTIAVYAYYKNEDYEKLNEVANDFIRLNPANDYVSYMLYMKGISHYNKIPNITKSQDDTQESSYIFRELIARYPDSKYAIDAKSKLDYIDEHLAGHLMSIGRYQIKVKNYIGAIKYFQKVTSRYHYTNQVSEGYFRLAEIYYKIGLLEEAKKAVDILKESYPQSNWSKKLTKFKF